MLNRHSKFNSLLFSLVAAAALVLAAPAAKAALSVTPHDVAGAPGSNVDVTFDFDFGANTLISSFDLGLEFDASLLTLLDGDFYQNGVPVDALAGLNSAGLLVPNINPSNGIIGVTWYAVDSNFQPLPPLALSGTYSLLLSFQLNNSFPIGQTSPVILTLDASDENAAAIDTIVKTANVAAVPLPPSLLMMLSGLGMLAVTRVRRSV
ncbi:hypothetical protein NP603_14930 [Methylomonas sp. SURF-1]|uniref:PEP-CTERM protein-sorting domain-containing protein n=1 Tax=Methylomonas aurea TaxID=2952224 RepID=A0ABT1UJM7_9GAMM|nr:hypothetical protein [Methylomonas sp. SURF-1]MCQ8182413.1 hypothetical protein [Methylomonas sp. SURF-1]